MFWLTELFRRSVPVSNVDKDMVERCALNSSLIWGSEERNRTSRFRDIDAFTELSRTSSVLCDRIWFNASHVNLNFERSVSPPSSLKWQFVIFQNLLMCSEVTWIFHVLSAGWCERRWLIKLRVCYVENRFSIVMSYLMRSDNCVILFSRGWSFFGTQWHHMMKWRQQFNFTASQLQQLRNSLCSEMIKFFVNRKSLNLLLLYYS